MSSWNTRSKAFLEFQESLGLAKALLKVEKQYPDPPPLRAQQLVEGLRGGAVILMVGAFENFLKKAILEHLSELSTPPKAPYAKFPLLLQTNYIFLTLDHAMAGPPPEKHLRLPKVMNAINSINNGIIDPSLFNDTRGNPGSKVVKALFHNIGKNDIFNDIRIEFSNRWMATMHRSYSLSATFIATKLDEIVNRRHEVAHTATVLNIARSDLDESVKFLNVLARSIDLELRKYIREIKR